MVKFAEQDRDNGFAEFVAKHRFTTINEKLEATFFLLGLKDLEVA